MSKRSNNISQSYGKLREQVWWARRVGELLSGVLVWCDITNNQIGCNETGFIEVKPLISFLHNWLKSIFHAALAYFFHYAQLVWLLWTKIKETLSINVANMKKLLQNWIQPIALLYYWMRRSFCWFRLNMRKRIYKGTFINNILANVYVAFLS